jgi:hypothetical protein
VSIFFWAVAIVGALLAGGQLFIVFDAAASAPQQAAGAAIALSLAVIPYCLARAISEITRDFTKQSTQQSSVAETATSVKPGIRNQVHSKSKHDVYAGESDKNSNDYRLFLCQKYGIERNETLSTYTMGKETFESLEDAVDAADKLEEYAASEADEKSRKHNVDFKRITSGDYDFILYKNALGEFHANLPGEGKVWFQSEEECRQYVASK